MNRWKNNGDLLRNLRLLAVSAKLRGSETAVSGNLLGYRVAGMGRKGVMWQPHRNGIRGKGGTQQVTKLVETFSAV